MKFENFWRTNLDSESRHNAKDLRRSVLNVCTYLAGVIRHLGGSGRGVGDQSEPASETRGAKRGKETRLSFRPPMPFNSSNFHSFFFFSSSPSSPSLYLLNDGVCVQPTTRTTPMEINTVSSFEEIFVSSSPSSSSSY